MLPLALAARQHVLIDLEQTYCAACEQAYIPYEADHGDREATEDTGVRGSAHLLWSSLAGLVEID